MENNTEMGTLLCQLDQLKKSCLRMENEYQWKMKLKKRLNL